MLGNNKTYKIQDKYNVDKLNKELLAIEKRDINDFFLYDLKWNKLMSKYSFNLSLDNGYSARKRVKTANKLKRKQARYKLKEQTANQLYEDRLI